MDDESAQALRGLVDRCARQEAWPPPRTELVYAILHENESDVSSLEHFEMEDMLEMELDEGAARAIMACVASGGVEAGVVGVAAVADGVGVEAVADAILGLCVADAILGLCAVGDCRARLERAGGRSAAACEPLSRYGGRGVAACEPP